MSCVRMTVSTFAAMPPDVRRRLCPAVCIRSSDGLRPRFGLGPEALGAVGRTKGAAHTKVNRVRRGVAFAAHQAAKPLRTGLLKLNRKGVPKPLQLALVLMLCAWAAFAQTKSFTPVEGANLKAKIDAAIAAGKASAS